MESESLGIGSSACRAAAAAKKTKPYDKAMSDSCLFAFYKNTMAGMDYTGYLNPSKLREYGKKGRPRK